MQDQKTTDDLTLTLVEERLAVGKRQVLDGRVRVTTRTETVSETVNDALKTDEVSVVRVPIGLDIDTAPQARTEGGITIIPVIEEYIVVEKRLRLVEEIHIRRSTEIEQVSIPVDLRKQRASIEHLTD